MTHVRHVYTGPSCPHCGGPLPADRRPGVIRCGTCWRDFEAAVFTPPEAEVRVSRLGESGPDGATPCADHPGNAAVSECARCGVFMCGLCRIDSDGQALCPACYERLSKEGALASARTSYRDFRGLGVKLAAVGLLFLFIGPLCGAAALFCAWKAWQQKKEWGDEDGYTGMWVLVAVAVIDILAGLGLYAVLIWS